MAEVRCDQCGRVLTPSEVRAGACPSCGRAVVNAADAADAETAGIATDDSGTRTIVPGQLPSPSVPPTAPPPPPADALTAPATPIAPYRPPALPRATPGAPPEALPAATQPPTGVEERTAAMPAHLVPIETEHAASGATRGAESDHKRGRFGWVSAFGLLIVLVLGSIGALLAANGQLGGLLGEDSATPTATATATPTAGPPPAPSGFTRYTAASFSIIHPTGWVEVVQPGGLVAFTSPGGGGNLIVQIGSQADPGTVDSVFIGGLGAFLLNGKSGSSVISNKTSPLVVTVAGTAWTREEADVAVTAGGTTTTWHVAALAATHDQQTYLISFYAPAAAFAAQDTAFFEPMVNSMLFISSQP